MGAAGHGMRRPGALCLLGVLPARGQAGLCALLGCSEPGSTGVAAPLLCLAHGE